MYKYINEPSDEGQQEIMWKTSAILRTYLSKEDDEILYKKFEEYRDSSHEKGLGFEPWYIWFPKQIDVTVKPKDCMK